nr:uncharacterized protein LOC109754329 isoform X2 [Aegilops tauschii subsp. strangulata]
MPGPPARRAATPSTMGAPRFFGRRRRLTAAARLRPNPVKSTGKTVAAARQLDLAALLPGQATSPNSRTQWSSRSRCCPTKFVFPHCFLWRIESVFKGFLFLILVHASTEISKYIWSILVFFLMSFTIHQVPLSLGSQVVLAITTCRLASSWAFLGTIPESSAVLISNACKAEIFLCDGIKWLVPEGRQKGDNLHRLRISLPWFCSEHGG